MTEPSDAPSDKPETTEGSAEAAATATPDDQTQPPGPQQHDAQPGGYPPPWARPGFAPPLPTSPKNGLGIASLVIAVIALMLVWSVLGGVIGGIIAVALGMAARGRVKRREANNGGVAIAGMALGGLAVVIGLAFIPIWAGFWQFVGGADYLDCMQSAGSDPVRQEQCTDEFRQDIQQKFSLTVTPSPLP